MTSLRALLERVLGAHGIRYELVEAGNAQELRTERMR